MAAVVGRAALESANRRRRRIPRRPRRKSSDAAEPTWNCCSADRNNVSPITRPHQQDAPTNCPTVINSLVMLRCGGRGHYAILRSVRLSVPALGAQLPWAIGTLAACLQLSHVRTADSSTDGRRSAASRTAIGGSISSLRPRGGDTLLAFAVCAC